MSVERLFIKVESGNHLNVQFSKKWPQGKRMLCKLRYIHSMELHTAITIVNYICIYWCGNMFTMWYWGKLHTVQYKSQNTLKCIYRHWKDCRDIYQKVKIYVFKEYVFLLLLFCTFKILKVNTDSFSLLKRKKVLKYYWVGGSIRGCWSCLAPDLEACNTWMFSMWKFITLNMHFLGRCI